MGPSKSLFSRQILCHFATGIIYSFSHKFKCSFHLEPVQDRITLHIICFLNHSASHLDKVNVNIPPDTVDRLLAFVEMKIEHAV